VQGDVGYITQLHHHGYLNPLTIGAWWVMLTKRVPQVMIAVTWTPKGGAEILGSQHDVCRHSTRLVKYHVLDLMNGAGTNTISVA
jgi:hypothetical protein